MPENNISFDYSLKEILIDLGIIFLFLLVSYLIIFSKYNFTIGDAGTYAFKTKILYERHVIDLKAQTALSLGQLIFGYIFCLIFGFSLKTLHISAYFAALFCMFSFYLLLLQMKIDRYLALIGSLCLFINPITIVFIDWYMTESYFLFYLFTTMNFFIAGFKYNKARYFYLGAIFLTISIFTRQFAVCLSVALIALLFFKRRQLKSNFIHILISSIVPGLSLAIFYLSYVKLGDTLQLYSPRATFLGKLTNPFHFIPVLLKDTLHTLHYSAIYSLPLILILLVTIFFNKKYFNKLLLVKTLALVVSFSFIGLGTLILFFRYKKLMPYLPSIFPISTITNFFGFKVMEKRTASLLLTIFSTLGGTIIFYKILEALDWNKFKNLLAGKDKGDGSTIALYFIYLTGLFYFLINSISFLLYDRYIFPVATFVIFFILLKCNWIRHFKKTALITFLIIYILFIFKIKKSRMGDEVTWDASNLLMEKGVKPIEINGGCGFGYYHNFYSIYEIYKNVKINRPVNWHKFHPLANYFILGSRKQGEHPGLELMDTIKKKSYFKIFEKEVYIFKRKANFKDPIWAR